MSAPLYSCAALGFRCFKVTSNNDSSLYPLNGGGHARTQRAWQLGSNLAECGLGPEHNAPSGSCQCGFHAYHSTELPARVLALEPGRVLAAVAGTGHLQVHKHGWRSQRAQVLGLWLHGQECEQIIKLGESYRIPCLATLEELQAVAKEYAQPVPNDLRPARSDDIAELQGWHSL